MAEVAEDWIAASAESLTFNPRCCMPIPLLAEPIVAIMLFLVSPLAALADESIYRCDDGTFTNVAERLCEPYEPKGTVLVRPEGASFASMRALLGEPAAKAAQLPDPASICNLYKEWQALNLRSGGGVTFANTQDVPRWMSLSRIFTAIGAPYCP